MSNLCLVSNDLLSIREAAAQGIDRLRKPTWANPLDHFKIDIINGHPGPWLHLITVGNKPLDILIVDPMVGSLDAKEFRPYREQPHE